MIHYRPIAMTDPARPTDALWLAGGWCWFDRVEAIERRGARRIVDLGDVPGDVLQRLTEPRAPLAGLAADRPRLMGILNVTPDSFSDGGQFEGHGAAVARARAMLDEGADIIDIGGESTRPGAVPVPEADECRRTVPVIAALRAAGLGVPVSIDTRNAGVAGAAVAAGAGLVNDVSALGHDPAMAGLVAERGVPVCLVHARGDPPTMQDDPHYDDVLLDVYDHLAARVALAEAAGTPRSRILLDPGIGFGKTVAHNLALIRGISLLHGLGCTVMLGASRKRFIGALSGGAEPMARMPGSVALALAGLAQGVQWLRVHDVGPTRQAVALWQAVTADPGSAGVSARETMR